MHEHDRDPKDNFVMSGGHPAGEEREEGYAYAAGDTSAVKRSVKPVLIAGAGLLVAVIVVLMFLSGSPKSGEREQVKNLEGRIKAVEEKLAKLEWLDTGMARLDRKEKEIASLSERILQLEASLNRKVDQPSKEQAKSAPKPPEPAPAKAESASPKAEAAAPKQPPAPAKTKLHTVQKGETLYSISRKYDLSVDQLAKLNKISMKDPIKPGQQLAVGPAK
jgi:LysM repeat protein